MRKYVKIINDLVNAPEAKAFCDENCAKFDLSELKNAHWMHGNWNNKATTFDGKYKINSGVIMVKVRNPIKEPRTHIMPILSQPIIDAPDDEEEKGTQIIKMTTYLEQKLPDIFDFNLGYNKFSYCSSPKPHIFRYIGVQIVFEDHQDILVFVTMNLFFKYLRRYRLIPGKNTPTQANQYALRMFRQWRAAMGRPATTRLDDNKEPVFLR